MSSTGTTAELYAALDRCLAAGETTAVATIVRRKGSTPREVGTKMLIRPNGDTDGTVGGGCGEADVWRTALDVMADREARMVTVDLTEEIALDTDGVCGGIMEIFVEPWTPATEIGSQDLVRDLLAAVAAKQAAVTVTVVGGIGRLPCALGSRLLVVDGAPLAGDLGWPWLQERVLADLPAVVAAGRSQTRSYASEGNVLPGATVSVFFELTLPKPVLVVVGAGHVAVPV